MTKSDIILKLAEEYNLSPRMSRLVVDSFFSNLVRGLLTDRIIILRGFGTFTVKVAKPRMSRNPQTGEVIRIGERRGIAFKIGRKLHLQINKTNAKV